MQGELVTIVDAENRVIGSAPKSRMRKERLIHRASFILVFNDTGEMFVQKRTMTKDIYPGLWDVAAGGVVLADESFTLSAELELGASGASPQAARAWSQRSFGSPCGCLS